MYRKVGRYNFQSTFVFLYKPIFYEIFILNEKYFYLIFYQMYVYVYNIIYNNTDRKIIFHLSLLILYLNDMTSYNTTTITYITKTQSFLAWKIIARSRNRTGEHYTIAVSGSALIYLFTFSNHLALLTLLKRALCITL